MTAAIPEDPAETAPWEAGKRRSPAVAEASVVRPGDRLLFQVSNDVTAERFEQFTARIKDAFPHNKVVVVACDRVLVIRGADEP